MISIIYIDSQWELKKKNLNCYRQEGNMPVQEIIQDLFFIERGIIKQKGGQFFTTIKP